MKNDRRQMDQALVEMVRKPTLSKSAVVAKRKPMGRESRFRPGRSKVSEDREQAQKGAP